MPKGVRRPIHRLQPRAYVWPDQPARRGLLDDAFAIARRDRMWVEQGGAAAWVVEGLHVLVEGCVIIQHHSIAREYFPDATKAVKGRATRRGGTRRRRRAARLAPFRVAV